MIAPIEIEQLRRDVDAGVKAAHDHALEAHRRLTAERDAALARVAELEARVALLETALCPIAAYVASMGDSLDSEELEPMGENTKIEWTDATWNPVRGCSRVSPGCGGPGPHGGCYAERVAARFTGPGQPYEGLAEIAGGKPRWTGKLSFGHNLEQPLMWRRPRRIFVNSMSDLFHEKLSAEEIATVFGVCIAAHYLNGHILQILTKRSVRMREVLNDEKFWAQANSEAGAHVIERVGPHARRSDDARSSLDDFGPDKPPPGIWLIVSTEDQLRANERVPDLLATPACVRGVSYEPALGPVDFTRVISAASGATINALVPWRPVRIGGTKIEHGPPSSVLDWIICGGESGPRARPMHPDWARSVRDQCASAGVSFHFKQWGEWAPPDQIPEELWTHNHDYVGDACVMRVGKSRAGRLLDGREHNDMPEVRRA